jgi:hypothetical protein
MKLEKYLPQSTQRSQRKANARIQCSLIQQVHYILSVYSVISVARIEV